MNNKKDYCFFNLTKAFEIANEVDIESRHRELMFQANVEFYDDDGFFVKKPAVWITGIGGIPASRIIKFYSNNGTVDKVKLVQDLEETIGASAAFSYMNSGNLSLNDLSKKVVHSIKHMSVLHTVYLNIGIFGISSAVEHEFDCQRDLIHLSRMTVAKTKSQCDPSVVVRNENHKELIAEVLFSTRSILEEWKANELSRKHKSKDFDLESINALFPTLKAHSLLVSGTLANFIKLLNGIKDKGKEDEYKEILSLIEERIKFLYT